MKVGTSGQISVKSIVSVVFAPGGRCPLLASPVAARRPVCFPAELGPRVSQVTLNVTEVTARFTRWHLSLSSCCSVALLLPSLSQHRPQPAQLSLVRFDGKIHSPFVVLTDCRETVAEFSGILGSVWRHWGCQRLGVLLASCG